MKRTIRQGCFETNSSSQHSICFMNKVPEVPDDELYDDIYVDKDGVWDLSSKYDGMDFGRYPFHILTTPGKKARYAIANLVQTKGDEAYEEIFRIIKKLYPELKDIKLNVKAHTTDYVKYGDKEWLEKRYPGTHKIIDENTAVYYEFDTGYVDDYLVVPFLKKYNISLEEFIIKRNIIVICDGDEYCEFEDAKKSGIINTANILIEYPDRSKPEWWKEIEDGTDD